MSIKRFTASKRYRDMEDALSQKLDQDTRCALGLAILNAESCLSASSAKTIGSEHLEAIRLHSQQLANALQAACNNDAFEITFWTLASWNMFPIGDMPFVDARRATLELTNVLRLCEAASKALIPKSKVRPGGQNKDHIALMSAILAQDFKRVMQWRDKPTRSQGEKIRKAAIAFHRNLPAHLQAGSDREFGSKVRVACVSPNFGMPQAWLHLLP